MSQSQGHQPVGLHATGQQLGTYGLGPDRREAEVVAGDLLVAVGVADDLYPDRRLEGQERRQPVQGGNRLEGYPVAAALELDRWVGRHGAQAGLEYEVGQGGGQVGGCRGDDRIDDRRRYVEPVLDADDVRLGEGHALGGLLQFGGRHPALQDDRPVDHPHLHRGQPGLDHGPLDRRQEILFGGSILRGAAAAHGYDEEDGDDQGGGDPGGPAADQVDRKGVACRVAPTAHTEGRPEIPISPVPWVP